MSAATQRYAFQSEVSELLQLMIHSLYSHKEIFVRELISNASDAIQKLRFLALKNPELYENDTILKLKISANPKDKTVTFSDNGIGMSEAELIEHLGTIARSGTKAFLSQLKQSEQKDHEASKQTSAQSLIGQFGVGFYSAFMVADRISVHSRKAGTPYETGTIWESTGDGEYTITPTPKAERGTSITLYLREKEAEFSETWNLRRLIQQFSEHLDLPVELAVPTEENASPKTTNETSSSEASDQTKPEHKELEFVWEQVNQAKALWLRPKKEITEHEYQEFYKNLTHDYNPPLLYCHNRVEGRHEYISLLYIPSKAPWDLWNREHKRGLKLYVKRVFIMEDAEQFLPPYLRFVRGILDSDDLPLNVSRELLQSTQLTHTLKQACTKRILDRLVQFAQEEPSRYEKEFWSIFGLVLKEGMGDHDADLKVLASLLRFTSTHTLTGDSNLTSLEAYVNRMPEQQKAIYYLTADHLAAAQNSPHLEFFRKHNIEVLLLTDRIDEWMMSYLPKFQDYPLLSIAQAGIELPKVDCNQCTDQDAKDAEESTGEVQVNSLMEKMKQKLGDQVEEVRLSQRLTETAIVLTTPKNALSTQMAKLLEMTGQPVPQQKYVVEINPKHPLIQHVAQLDESEKQEQWIAFLFKQAKLVDKGSIEDPSSFVKEMNQLLGF